MPRENVRQLIPVGLRGVGVRLGIVAGFAAGAIALYSQTIGSYFVCDDFEELLGSITDGPRSTTAIHPGRNFRPINQWLHAIAEGWFGTRPLGHHLLSLGLHVVISLTVIVLGAELTRRFEVAARSRAVISVGGGALFLVHPSHTEAVSWISARSDLLMTLGLVTGLICWLRSGPDGSPRRWWWVAASCACGAFALASKEPAVTLPLVASSVEVALTFGSARPTPRRVARAAARPWPLYALLVAYVAARQMTLGTLKSDSWTDEFVGDSVIELGARWIVTIARAFVPGMSITGWAVTLVLVVAVAISVRNATANRRSMLVGPAALLAAVAISVGPLARLGTSWRDTGGERFTYFPSALAAIVIAWLVVIVVKPHRRGVAISMCVVVASLLLVPSQIGWAQAAEISRGQVASEGAMLRDRPVLVLNLLDNVNGAFVARNAFGSDLRWIHHWQELPPAWGASTYETPIAANHVTARRGPRHGSWIVTLMDPGARFLGLAAPGGSGEAPGVTVRSIDERQIEVTVGEDAPPGLTVWLGDGDRYRKLTR